MSGKMGDKLVSDVVESLSDVIFANCMNVRDVRIVVNMLVNRLRNSGWSDDVIRQDLITG